MDISTIDCLIVIASYMFAFGVAVILEASKKSKKRRLWYGNCYNYFYYTCTDFYYNWGKQKVKKGVLKNGKNGKNEKNKFYDWIK